MKLSWQSRLFVLRHLATGADAGMPLHRALDAAAREVAWGFNRVREYELPIDVPYFSARLSEVADALEAGEKLSVALARLPKIFSNADLILIAGAEASGTLPKVLKLMIAHARDRRRSKQWILALAVYPATQLTVVAITLTYLSIFILPKFMAIFRDLTEGAMEWPYMGLLQGITLMFK